MARCVFALLITVTTTVKVAGGKKSTVEIDVNLPDELPGVGFGEIYLNS